MPGCLSYIIDRSGGCWRSGSRRLGLPGQPPGLAQAARGTGRDCGTTPHRRLQQPVGGSVGVRTRNDFPAMTSASPSQAGPHRLDFTSRRETTGCGVADSPTEQDPAPDFEGFRPEFWPSADSCRPGQGRVAGRRSSVARPRPMVAPEAGPAHAPEGLHARPEPGIKRIGIAAQVYREMRALPGAIAGGRHSAVPELRSAVTRSSGARA
jgi:hypothetical protein